jgi:hypothetical protein
LLDSIKTNVLKIIYTYSTDVLQAKNMSLPIIMTGTIIPNAISTKHVDLEDRRKEYLENIHFYSKFSTVFFLENSSYDLLSDPDFNIKNVHLRKFKPSLYAEKGKGFQEFEMIDSWIKTEKNLPERWIKVTGRYKFLNFQQLLSDCEKNPYYDLIADRNYFFKLCHTHIFCVNSNFYKTTFLGLYNHCDDRVFNALELVVEREVTQHMSSFRIFSVEPELVGISGTLGTDLKVSSIVYNFRKIARAINYKLDPKSIWYRRWY